MNQELDLGLWIGPLLALTAVSGLLASGQSADLAIVVGVALLCIVWWISESVPIPITSLIPLAVLPMFGILTPAQVGQAYGSPLILLLLGGFLLSKSLEHTGAHRRMALGMIRWVGSSSGFRLVFGFSLAAALLSMWISNTATTLMLLPVALAVLDGARDQKKIAPALLLGLAYGASIGGLGTPIGTPANLIFMQVYETTTGQAVSFVQWMSWGLPVVLVLIPCVAWYLARHIDAPVRIDLPSVEQWHPSEKRVLLIFGLTALAWITRTGPFGGWSSWLHLPTVNDASVALLAVVALASVSDARGGRLLTWERAAEIPWGVLLLFAGGICLAAGFEASGLSQVIAQVLVDLTQLPTYWLILSICLIVTFTTETTSNTASTALLMPILAATAMAGGIRPELIMVPAVMSASCAFMLPVATAPNSVVFGSGRIGIRVMAREGAVVNLFAAVVISLVCFALLG
ncbi:MAG: SLC13 family permease [Proteobacteria bacterium]|jgi:solute carrier family 13 (sodium-dependent dicarboxylate transporter), member 2/3/5|nr:SLC13 family permease [Pseudomonadota bacterium]HBZ50279.1 sodium:dicarboxylate symporter [Halieaceae bacterium]